IAADAVRRILLKDHAPSGRYFFDFDTLAPRNIDGEPSQCAKLNSPKMQFLAEAPTGSITPNEKAIYSLVEKACRAPSGGNTQPWRWIASGPSLFLCLDESRISDFVDCEFGGSFAALGAAAENLRLSAQSLGLEVAIRTFPSNDDPTHAATFHFFRE